MDPGLWTKQRIKDQGTRTGAVGLLTEDQGTRTALWTEGGQQAWDNQELTLYTVQISCK